MKNLKVAGITTFVLADMGFGYYDKRSNDFNFNHYFIDNCLDPFAGSGTLGEAACELNIPCTLIEIDSEQVNFMVKKFSFLDRLAKPKDRQLV